MGSQARSINLRVLWIILTLIVISAVVLLLARFLLPFTASGSTTNPTPPATNAPEIEVTVVAEGLTYPWDLGFLPSGELVFTERGGQISLLRDGQIRLLEQVSDVRAAGEGGLLGLAVDPNFSENRYLFACFNSSLGSDIRVVRWQLSSDLFRLENKTDIITGIPANTSGRHSGCQLDFGPDETLWVGTGDSAQNGRSPQTPQDPQSLGGKILRVNRDGRPVADNLELPFDPRIYSYGHRNTQGLAFLPSSGPGGIIGYSAEHGSTIDDEVNPLLKGNFGWNPDANYTEVGVAMTDKQKFPDAIDPIWRSGSPTQAPSGLAILIGNNWKDWDGALAMSMLRAEHLKILTRDSQGAIVKEDRLVTNHGRLRAAHTGMDGNLYVTTSNGQDDKIIRLSPKP